MKIRYQLRRNTIAANPKNSDIFLSFSGLKVFLVHTAMSAEQMMSASVDALKLMVPSSIIHKSLLQKVLIFSLLQIFPFTHYTFLFFFFSIGWRFFHDSSINS